MNCYNHCTHNQAVDGSGFVHCAILGGNAWVKPDTVTACNDYRVTNTRAAHYGVEYWEPPRHPNGRVMPKKFSKKHIGG